MTVAAVDARFALDPSKLVRANVEQLVYSGVALEGAVRDRRAEIVDHIMRTGECLLHAVHVVYATPTCYCAPCSKARGES